MEELTCPNTTSDLITISNAFSVDLLISGKYCFNNPASSWSDERSDSAYSNSTVRGVEWGVEKDER